MGVERLLSETRFKIRRGSSDVEVSLGFQTGRTGASNTTISCSLQSAVS